MARGLSGNPGLSSLRSFDCFTVDWADCLVPGHKMLKHPDYIIMIYNVYECLKGDRKKPSGQLRACDAVSLDR